LQLMKPITDLEPLLTRAIGLNLFGTKMRSLIKLPNAAGIKAIVSQQFEIGRRIAAVGLAPILEPEVDIHSPGKAEAESMLKAAIADELAEWPNERPLMLKLTLPDEDNLYAEFVADPKVLRVVALSGGYRRDEANEILARNDGVIASFSRALTEGLSAQQTDAEFDAMLDETIAGIYKASAFKVAVH
jgi:fructose-bisphosphate aldolase class I